MFNHSYVSDWDESCLIFIRIEFYANPNFGYGRLMKCGLYVFWIWNVNETWLIDIFVYFSVEFICFIIFLS